MEAAEVETPETPLPSDDESMEEALNALDAKLSAFCRAMENVQANLRDDQAGPEEQQSAAEDSDTLDGLDSSDFAESDHAHNYSRTLLREYYGQSIRSLNNNDRTLHGQGIPLPLDLTGGGNIQLDVFFIEYGTSASDGNVVLSIYLSEYTSSIICMFNLRCVWPSDTLVTKFQDYCSLHPLIDKFL